MKHFELNDSEVVDLGTASVETKGAGLVFTDNSGGQRIAPAGSIDD
jgi:hypothetical protein